MGDDNVAPPVTTVVEGGKELTAPVVEHTERITRIEEHQAQQEEKLYRDLQSLREELANASSEQISGIHSRMDAIETKLSELLAKSTEEVEEVPEGAVEMVTPEVQVNPEPPEKQRQSRRFKRKARRKAS